MPLTFNQKLAQTRTYTQTNQLGVDSQEVYNEAILQALDLIGPGGTGLNTPTAEVVTGTGIVPEGFVAVSLFTSTDFVGTILGASVPASTTVNINAEVGATLTQVPYVVSAGNILVVKLARP